MAFHQGEVNYSLRGSYHGSRNIGQSLGKMMFTTNGGGLDEYFAAISSLRLPEDMERLQEISKFYRYEYLPARNDQYTAELHGTGTTGGVHVPDRRRGVNLDEHSAVCERKVETGNDSATAFCGLPDLRANGSN